MKTTVEIERNKLFQREVEDVLPHLLPNRSKKLFYTVTTHVFSSELVVQNYSLESRDENKTMIFRRVL
jgi:hypothetical protein